MPSLRDTVGRLATGSQGRTEADIQADVRDVLLTADLELTGSELIVSLEAQAGGGRRIDVEAGSAIIEVKKNLGSTTVVARAIEQLAGYVQQRTDETGRRFVGVLTDGRDWRLFHLTPMGHLAQVAGIIVKTRRDAEPLAAWLEAVLATTDKVRPTAREVTSRLGANSPAALLDLADLRALYEACRDVPEVRLKRELWARLLLAALGTNFEDSDDLFVTHTYLVLTAELVAHEVMGISVDVPSSDIRALLEGRQFKMAGLHGVVEADFFDWPALVDEGRPTIAGIARRLARFDWNQVEHDVLKTLYQSIIDAETRKRLGEYYTPDWLADKMVREHYTDPLHQRLLDPACGSGTFLFWAIRRLLASCDAAGMTNRETVNHVVRNVFGMDLHPVAVTLARVTYLLALTPERLRDRDALAVPVYLGDSVRWEHDDTLLSKGGLTIHTSDDAQPSERELHFPEGVVDEPARFDRLVAALAERASDRPSGTKPPAVAGLLTAHKVLGVPDREAMQLVFEKLCRLHDGGRDHLWSYYVRNLARPLSFTRPQGRVDLLIGNPPWLAFRHMPKALQATYQKLASSHGLWSGGKMATHQDLSDLFVARSIDQYLKPGGAFAFVMPFATLSRRQFIGFRTGNWSPRAGGALFAEFGRTEEFSRVKPPLFPVPCCVVTGRKSSRPGPLNSAATSWAGQLPGRAGNWATTSEVLHSVEESVERSRDDVDSHYQGRFSQGATLVPRLLVTVRLTDAGPLGAPAGHSKVRSARSTIEKKPWKGLRSLEGTIEAAFVRPMHTGSTIVAFCAREPELAVVPWLDGDILTADDQRLDEHPGLASWWRTAEALWAEYRSEKSPKSLTERINYHRGLHRQLPGAPHRVVYTSSGQFLAAARVEDPRAVVDSNLYWSAVASPDEGRYLCAVLNSGVIADAVKPLQARGQHNPRHFHLLPLRLGIPPYMAGSATHKELADLGAHAESVAASLPLNDEWRFEKARRAIREALQSDGVAAKIDIAVRALLTQDPRPSEQPTPDLMGQLAAAKDRTGTPARRASRPQTIPQLDPAANRSQLE